MTAQLQQLDIFDLRPLITNLNCKLSAVTEFTSFKQLLCLVSEENDIVLRYTCEDGQEVLKMISWFRRTNRVIHDVCFDPTGVWLLVLCFDNTLHIVPAMAVVDKSFLDVTNAKPQQPYSTTQVTSYIIPFVGPHECPNSKKCPNHSSGADPATRPPHSYRRSTAEQEDESTEKNVDEKKDTDDSSSTVAAVEQLSHALGSVVLNDEQPSTSAQPQPCEDDCSMVVIEPEHAVTENVPPTMEAFSHDIPDNMLGSNGGALQQQQQQQQNIAHDATGNSQMMANSFMASSTCPYPLSVVWWQTIDGLNRAVIGYSDGSICFVGLSPMCPFVASTAIDSGSAVKLLICKDITFESVMLLITSSLKQQYKLLLEQKAIKYTYPGDSSSPGAQGQNPNDNDWQIVMPLKSSNSSSNNNNNNTTSNSDRSSSDPASDSSSSQHDDDKSSALDDDELPSTSAAASAALMLAPQTQASSSIVPVTGSSPQTVSVFRMRPPSVPPPSYSTSTANQMPPPPPYSVAINRHLVDSGTTTTVAGSQNPAATATVMATGGAGGGGVRFSQQNLNDFDDYQGRGGILPAARARLASLKSLGSKKLNAIKMRLSDNRQKLEECIPENTLGSSFAIMDSPSLTPELLGTAHGSFYTIQNLRNTYLLSALHTESNSLSVHSIDVHLKTLILYKIPKNCLDILISSNILYFIQYVEKKAADERPVKLPAVKPSIATLATDEKESDVRDDAANTEKENRDRDTEKLEPAGVGEFEVASKASSASSSATQTSGNLVNAVGVISSAMATLRSGEDDNFNEGSQLGLFRFEHETVLSLYQMATYSKTGVNSSDSISKEEKRKAFQNYKDIKSPEDYVRFYETADHVQEELSLRQMEIMQNEFPKINYDPCYVVTNKNVYYVQLKKEPFAIFLDAAMAGEWRQCREFCNTFNLNFEQCIEFAGDYLLRRKKVTQALVTYNTARIKPIRTALKLAIYGHTCALMHLCAMALKTTFLLKSKYFTHPIIKTLMPDITYRHSEDVRNILPPPSASSQRSNVVVNEGEQCSDYVYGVDDPWSNLQMSASSQFHLANLLLITLAERAVNDKNYLPLWNFLVTNTKYHTNMTSIVLCQSGLFSAALILAKIRGVCLDTFPALTSVVGQEFGWYTELNVCLYNLSEPLFIETIAYLPQVSMDYFCFIQDKLDHMRQVVVKRLEAQLNPFSPTLRPIVSHTSAFTGHHLLNRDNQTEHNLAYMFEFCKSLIETYLAVLIHMESQRTKVLNRRQHQQQQHITNALSTFRITYEDNQFAIESSRFKPISAGCAHCACVVDGVAYFWGSNGVPSNYSINKCTDPPEPPHAVKILELLAQLNLEVHAIKCGRQHTLVLTNNGLYSFGSNNQSQLGIGRDMQVSLQPMLVKTLDGKNITVLEAGQYHNAAVADGQLYTWGWGVYGQLGHGDTENVPEPKLVGFFKYKRVIQVSLGHAHSMVLCNGAQNTTELYVFGSNHFGQLGIGSAVPLRDGDIAIDGDASTRPNDDALHSSSQVKSLLPLRLDVSTARIRLIHTKFFTNLAVDENERMYTWGSSPQALRLANQIKKRANARQKVEEHQRREMSKRFEATLTLNTMDMGAAGSSSSSRDTIDGPAERSEEECAETGTGPLPMEESREVALKDKFAEATASSAGDLDIIGGEPVVTETVVPSEEPTRNEDISLDNNQQLETKTLLSDCEEEKQKIEKPEAPQKQPSTESVDPCEHMSPQLVDTTEVAGQILQISSGLFHFALISSSCTLYTWGKNLEHQLGTMDKERRAVNKPSAVDAIERPMYVDCGADFTLVMSTDYVVKAFGGNSNGQCGRDLGATIDKMKQRVVCLPTTKRLMRFESQCVDVPVEINLPRPRIRLDRNEPVRYLKSIPRYQSDFLQEASINFEDNALPVGDRLQNYIGRHSGSASASEQYKSTTMGDSESDREAVTGQDSDDLISSLENYSNRDDGSLVINISSGGDGGGSGGAAAAVADSLDNNAQSLCPPAVESATQASSRDDTPDEQSYARLLAPTTFGNGGASSEDNGNEPLLRGTDDSPARCTNSANSLTQCTEGHVDDDDDDIEEGDLAQLQELRHYIHYCLYMFHGLYNPDKVREFAKDRLEYRIRTQMLNFKFVDAFTLCLQACDTPTKALRIFEYFTRDTSSYVHVPMRRQDLKYLIYYLMLHFLRHKFEMLECEGFFLGDLDYYLLELSYVLYFNNNNTVLEQTLNQKFKDLIATDDEDGNLTNITTVAATTTTMPANQVIENEADSRQRQHKLKETDVIFDSLSVKFKTIVCQRLLKHCAAKN